MSRVDIQMELHEWAEAGRGRVRSLSLHGHGLLNEGRVAGRGRTGQGRCSCGERSPVLGSDAERKRWYRPASRPRAGEAVRTAPDGLPEWDVGDRVARPLDVHKRRSGWRHGEVVAHYAEPAYPSLYAVLWDGDTRPQQGYVGWGLNPGSQLDAMGVMG